MNCSSAFRKHLHYCYWALHTVSRVKFGFVTSKLGLHPLTIKRFEMHSGKDKQFSGKGAFRITNKHHNLTPLIRIIKFFSRKFNILIAESYFTRPIEEAEMILCVQSVSVVSGTASLSLLSRWARKHVLCAAWSCEGFVYDSSD